MAQTAPLHMGEDHQKTYEQKNVLLRGEITFIIQTRTLLDEDTTTGFFHQK